VFKYTTEEWNKIWAQYERDIAEEFLCTSNPLELHQVLLSARMLKVWMEARNNEQA
jgi:hypothetical protein